MFGEDCRKRATTTQRESAHFVKGGHHGQKAEEDGQGEGNVPVYLERVGCEKWLHACSLEENEEHALLMTR